MTGFQVHLYGVNGKEIQVIDIDPEPYAITKLRYQLEKLYEDLYFGVLSSIIITRVKQ